MTAVLEYIELYSVVTNAWSSELGVWSFITHYNIMLSNIEELFYHRAVVIRLYLGFLMVSAILPRLYADDVALFPRLSAS